jgi:hypothetical protein
VDDPGAVRRIEPARDLNRDVKDILDWETFGGSKRTRPT